MRKTVKRITAFMLALAVLMTTVNWSFVREQTEAEMKGTSSGADSTQSETGTSENNENKDVPVYTFPLEVESNAAQEEITEEPDWTITYENEEVKVTVSGAEGVVPEGTTVKVAPILADNADTQSQYEEVAAQLQGTVEGRPYEIAGFLAYDITLLDAEGNEIEPDGDVKVSMEYIKATLPEGMDEETASKALLSVHHLVEDEHGQVKEVVDLSAAESESQTVESLLVDDAQAIAKAEFVTDSFSTYTITWTQPDPDKVLKVRIVINGIDHWGLVSAQYNDNNPDDDTSGLKNTYATYEVAGVGNVTGQVIYDQIKNDPFLQGTKFIGMQLGTYDPEETYDEGVSYISAISYNNGWTYNPVAGGGWYDPAIDDDFNKDDPYVTLVLESYLEVHVVDTAGNPIALDKAPATYAALPSTNGGNIVVNGWEQNAGIYYLKFSHAVAAGGVDASGEQIAEYIKGNSALQNYEYMGSALNAYNANTTPGVYAVSFNCTANSNRTWQSKTGNGNFSHWTTNGGEYPKMYLVYGEPDTEQKTLHVKAIDAETGKEINNGFDITFTGTNSTAVSTLVAQMQTTYPDLSADYTYLGSQPGAYVYGPDGEVWIYNIAYSNTDKYWSYTTSNAANASYNNWMQGNEATISLIYDKNNNELHQVETLYTSGTGIYMRLLDYSTYGQDIMKNDPAFTGQLGGGYNNSPSNGNIKAGILQRVLGPDGYPVTADLANDNGQAGLSLAPLFAGDYWGDGYTNPTDASKWVQSQGEVDGLFRKDIYEETGYYSYSSFENYAYYDGWEFIVYEEIGTPNDTGDDSRFYFNRGNFMPFNAIDANQIATRSRNWYNGDGSVRDPNDPASRYGETLYKTQGDNNYWFGMYIEADFYKPEGGLVENPSTGAMEDMVYKFNGDDDLWIYVDNVLLLDIGGIHDAHDGQIDFATGIITWSDCRSREEPVTYTTTIKEQFRLAGIFPDGTTWDDNKVDDYFVGDTFKDFTTHVMKMFYMERGAGASNLQMSFNLKVIPDQTLEVSKALSGDDEDRYVDDVEFAFQLWAQKPDPDLEDRYLNEMEPIEWDAIYKETGAAVTYDNSVVIDGVTYNHVFYIKPGEIVQFTQFPENREYQIVEIGLKDDMYGDAYFNGNPALIVKDEDGNVIGQGTGRAVAGATPVVAITNTCITGDFEITKKMKDGQTSNDSFSFKVWVEDMETGKLVPYVGNYYVNDSAEPLQTTDGIISGIKVDDKVVLKAFFNGTRFYVDELEYEGKYLEPDKQSTNETDAKLPIEGLENVTEVTADGVVTGEANGDGVNPIVTLTVTNEYKPSVTVTKQWNDVENRTRDGIYVGLYEQVNNNGVMEERYVGKDAALLNADNNWTHTWQYVENGKTYLVKEFRLAQEGETTGIISIAGQNYVPVAEGQSVVVSSVKYNVDYSDKTDTKDTNGGAVEAFTVTNTIVWNIVKTGLGEDNQHYRAPLAGAKFALINNDDTTIKYTGLSRAGDGIIEWTKDDVAVSVIPDGTYTFQEVKAPVGYLLNTDTWTITVENGVPKTVTGNEATGTIDETTHELVFKFHNSPMYDLPSSGSFGIFGYVAGGIIIMLAAVILVFKSSGKRSILEK